MRLRKQKEVQKENEFYMQLLQQALPPEQQMLQKQEKEAEEGRSLPWSCVGSVDESLFCLSVEFFFPLAKLVGLWKMTKDFPVF